MSEIKTLEEIKLNMEKAAQKSIDFYLKLILLISIVHVTSFYYMIFEVEWLGWDIIEPITYTVAMFSVILGIRFFLRYRIDRDWTNMQNIWRSRLINKNKNLRD